MERLSQKKMEELLGKKVAFYQKIGSTFDDPSDIVIAASQNQGRGRLERTFYSPMGGIYFGVKTELVPLLTISAAVAVMRTLETKGFSPSAKWVNDINIDGKKVCGILCRANGRVATIGVGINYCIKRFPNEIAKRAGSLYQSSLGINEFAAEVIRQVLKSVKSAQANMQYYQNRLEGIGTVITLPDGSKAVMEGIDKDGSLIYIQGGRQNRLFYGDIML